MLANRLEQSHVFRAVGSSTLRVQRNRAERSIFTKQRRNQHAAEAFDHLFRNSNQIKVGRRVTHRTGVCYYPASDAVTDIDTSTRKDFDFLAEHVRRYGFT